MADPTHPPDHRLAGAERTGGIQVHAERGGRLDAAEPLDRIRQLHERYGLPPVTAPKRAAA